MSCKINVQHSFFLSLSLALSPRLDAATQSKSKQIRDPPFEKCCFRRLLTSLTALSKLAQHKVSATSQV